MNVSAIVAMTPDGLMGRSGDRAHGLPWSIPEDLAHFKRTTKGHACLMGRGTWDMLAGALPHRLNLVVSRQAEDGEERDGAHWFRSLDKVADWIEGHRAGLPSHELFVLGGAQVFRQVLDGSGPPALCPTKLVVTWVPAVEARPGDTIFPFDRAWIEARFDVERRWPGETRGVGFVIYRRRSALP